MCTRREVEPSGWPVRAGYRYHRQPAEHGAVELPHVCRNRSWADSPSWSFRRWQGFEVWRGCSRDAQAGNEIFLGAILIPQDRRRKSDHPAWALARLAVIMIPVSVVLWFNATKFDKTEAKAIFELLIVGGGIEGIRLLKGR